MNKIIFQIGILGFCIAAVIFGGSGGGVLDIVSRAFIVFVGVVLAVTAVVLVGGTMIEKNSTTAPATEYNKPKEHQK